MHVVRKYGRFGIAALPLLGLMTFGSSSALAQREGVTEAMRQQCKAQVRVQKPRTRAKRQVAYLQCLADRINRLNQQPLVRGR
jgi:hypothetical protein